MHKLEIPHTLTGARIERQEGIAIQIRSFAVRAVQIVGRRTEREVGNCSFLIERNFPPGVVSAHTLPGIWRKRIVSELAWTGNCVKDPSHLPAAYVIGSDISRRRTVGLPRRRTENKQIFEDAPRSAALYLGNGGGIPVQSLAKIDFSLVAEGCDRNSPVFISSSCRYPST